MIKKKAIWITWIVQLLLCVVNNAVLYRLEEEKTYSIYARADDLLAGTHDTLYFFGYAIPLFFFYVSAMQLGIHKNVVILFKKRRQLLWYYAKLFFIWSMVSATVFCFTMTGFEIVYKKIPMNWEKENSYEFFATQKMIEGISYSRVFMNVLLWTFLKIFFLLLLLFLTELWLSNRNLAIFLVLLIAICGYYLPQNPFMLRYIDFQKGNSMAIKACTIVLLYMAIGGALDHRIRKKEWV